MTAPVMFHQAGPTDPVTCEVRCLHCGCLLAGAYTWQAEVIERIAPGVERVVGYQDQRAPAAFRPSEGQIVGLRGNGPYFDQFRPGAEQAATCAAAAAKVA